MKRIAVHSVPRSGSTWVGNIFNSHPNVAFRYQPLFSYAFKGILNQNSSSDEIKVFFNNILQSDDDFLNQEEAVKKGIVPSFSKDFISHICYKEVRYHHILENLLRKDEELIVIGIIRNPSAVLNSWWKAPKEFKSELGWSFDNEWLEAPSKNLDKVEEFNGYNKWKEVANLFHKLRNQYPQRFYLLEYRELLKNPIEETRKVMTFCGLDINEQQINFILESRSKNSSDAYSVFKNKSEDNSWVGSLPKYIVDYIQKDLENSVLKKYL